MLGAILEIVSSRLSGGCKDPWNRIAMMELRLPEALMCFSLAWLQQIFVWFVVILAILALLRLVASALSGAPMWPLVSWPPSGQPSADGVIGFILAALDIIVWAFIAIALIYFVFMLIGCLLSFTGGFPSLIPHRLTFSGASLCIP